MKQLKINALLAFISLILTILSITPKSYLHTNLEQPLAINDGDITTIAGIPPFNGDNIIATDANLYSPTSFAVDKLGNIFIVDSLNYRIRRIDAQTHIIKTVVGNGSPIFGGDGGLAINAGLVPTDITIDSMNNLIITDTGNHRIRKVDSNTGIITTIAGGGTIFEDNPSPTNTRLLFPEGVVVDSIGNILIADTFNRRIRKIDAKTGAISTIAGNNVGFSGDGSLAIDANFRLPVGITVDNQDNIFIADALNNRIRRIDAKTAIINTVAGNGGGQFVDNVPPRNSGLRNPQDVFVDSQGNLFITDSGNHRIRRVDAATNIISTIAGSDPFGGFAGDNGIATSALLFAPTAVALDPKGNLLIVDANNDRIRKVDSTTNIITTIAGKNRFGFSGDGGLATKAMLGGPYGLTIDKQGNILFVDALNSCVRQVDKSGIISTIAGNGKQGFSGDGAIATQATMNFPSAIAIDSSGNILVADTFNYRIRRIDATTKIITTIAGNGENEFSGDGGLATDAGLVIPSSLAVDSKNNILILTLDGRIRKVDPTGKITRIVGTGEQAFAGDNGLATNATLNFPSAIALDKLNNIFIADTDNNRIRRVDANSGIITTVAGNGSQTFSGDGGPAIKAGISFASAITLDKDNNLIIGDSSRIRKVDSITGIISTIVGTGFLGASGDGGPAIKASLTRTDGLVLDNSNNLYFSDINSNIVRMVKGIGGASPVSDFKLSVNPSSLTVLRGKNGQFNINIERTGNFTGNVTVMAPDTKQIKAKLTPLSQSTAGATASFTIKVKSKAPVGSQSLVFSGKDDSGRIRTTTLTLLIQ